MCRRFYPIIESEHMRLSIGIIDIIKAAEADTRS